MARKIDVNDVGPWYLLAIFIIACIGIVLLNGWWGLILTVLVTISVGFIFSMPYIITLVWNRFIATEETTED